MADSDDLIALLDALRDGASAEEFGRIVARPDLGRALRSVGVPPVETPGWLEAAARPEGRGTFSPEGTEVIEYFRALRAARPEIDEILRALVTDETDLVRSAFERTRPWLPPGTELGEVRLVLVPLGFDFRTDRETVYIDPLAAVALGRRGTRATLSHELHHVARYRRTGENLTLMRPEEDPVPETRMGLAAEWARWLEAEGIADAVSNVTQTPVEPLRRAAEQRRQQMDEYASLFRGATAHLRDTPDGALGWEALRRELHGLAHPVGARMAEAIAADLGREALVDCVGRPVEFVRAFEEVARRRAMADLDVAWLVSLAAGAVTAARSPPSGRSASG